VCLSVFRAYLMFCFLVFLLSVPMQPIAWKDLSLKLPRTLSTEQCDSGVFDCVFLQLDLSFELLA